MSYNENMTYKQLSMFHIAFCRLHAKEISFKEATSCLGKENITGLSNFFIRKNIPLYPYKTEDEKNDEELVRIHNQDVPR